MEREKQIQAADLGWVHWLRMASAFAVVMIHVCAKDYTVPDPAGSQWQTMAAYESVIRWCVPAFVMISGALLLDGQRQMPLKKLFRKYFLHILGILVFWSLGYALLYTGIYLKKGPREILAAAWEGYPHLWYLYMLLGLYLITPLLRPIAQSEKTMGYFVALAAAFSVLLPALENLGIAAELRYFASRLNVYTVLGYSGYFVLGRLLTVRDLSPRQRLLLYLVTAAVTVACSLANGLGSAVRGEIHTPFLGYFSPNVALQAASVFVFARSRAGDGPAPGWVCILSRLSFGIYLIHEVPIDFLRRFCGLSTMTLHPLLSVPLITLLSFGISALAAAILSRIPILKKTIS